MIKQLEKVAEFHKKFEVVDGTSPQLLSSEESRLRFNLMREENEEYLDACINDDLVEMADALGDQLYILCGTILKHGMQHKIDEVLDEIHKSNMSKLGEDGKPVFRSDKKIIKGPNYFRPDIKTILNK